MEFPVSIVTKLLPHSSASIKVYYPVVTSLHDVKVQSTINHTIITKLNDILVEQSFYKPELVELVAYFEIKNNQRNVLSLSLIVYSFTGGAHGMTIVKSLTFDTTIGKHYDLDELFKPGSDYQKRLSESIKVHIKEWDIQLLEPFKEIRKDQDYYIGDTSIIIYFQLYEISPYVYGFPYFPIPILDIADIVRQDRPLDKMMAFT